MLTLLYIIGAALLFDLFMVTIGVWLLDQIVIFLANYGKPEPDSNAALKEWLLANPDKDISQFPLFQ